MSEQPIHNNPWAEKLQQVSLPEAGEARQKMLELLDREWPQPPRKDYRRWILLVLLLLLLTGVCNCPGPARLNRHPIGKPAASGNQTNIANNFSDRIPSNLTERQATSRPLPGATSDNAGGKPALTTVEKHTAGRHENQKQATHRYKKRGHPASVMTAGDKEKKNTDRTGAGKKTTIRQTERVEPPADDTMAIGSLTNNDTLAAIPVSLPRADTLLKKTTSDKEKDSTAKKPAKNPQKGWAFAAGLDQSFPLGRQQRVNAGNGISNYIPVPQLCYHFNEKWYVQIELAVNAPQYTRPLLLQQRSDSVTGGRLLQQVYLQKLFYLQAPLGVYYSPVKNGYIGVGIRTGRLHDALGLYEYRIRRNAAPDSIVSSKTQSLKNDSALLYPSFRAIDWQWFAELNYHYGKFSVGIRYNQSLGSYIAAGLSIPPTIKAANSSLQLNVRYTIWRQRPKKKLAVK